MWVACLSPALAGCVLKHSDEVVSIGKRTDSWDWGMDLGSVRGGTAETSSATMKKNTGPWADGTWGACHERRGRSLPVQKPTQCGLNTTTKKASYWGGQELGVCGWEAEVLKLKAGSLTHPTARLGNLTEKGAGGTSEKISQGPAQPPVSPGESPYQNWLSQISSLWTAPPFVACVSHPAPPSPG